MGGLCVHESLPMDRSVDRQFIRISMPSKAGWYSNCTPNPLGIEPEGPILPHRPKKFSNFRMN